MQRPLAEVLASQEQMLRNRGTSDPGANISTVVKAFQDHLFEVNSWLTRKPNLKLIRVQYHQILAAPREISEKLRQFLGIRLDIDAMARQVDQTLYRQRARQAT